MYLYIYLSSLFPLSLPFLPSLSHPLIYLSVYYVLLVLILAQAVNFYCEIFISFGTFTCGASLRSGLKLSSSREGLYLLLPVIWQCTNPGHLDILCLRILGLNRLCEFQLQTWVKASLWLQILSGNFNFSLHPRPGSRQLCLFHVSLEMEGFISPVLNFLCKVFLLVSLYCENLGLYQSSNHNGNSKIFWF